MNVYEFNKKILLLVGAFTMVALAHTAQAAKIDLSRMGDGLNRIVEVQDSIAVQCRLHSTGGGMLATCIEELQNISLAENIVKYCDSQASVFSKDCDKKNKADWDAGLVDQYSPLSDCRFSIHAGYPFRACILKYAGKSR